jgi:hypothetical protein
VQLRVLISEGLATMEMSSGVRSKMSNGSMAMKRLEKSWVQIPTTWTLEPTGTSFMGEIPTSG